MIKLQKSTFVVGAAVLLIAAALVLLFNTLNPKTPNWTTAQVERGGVSEVVSVSGFVEAKNKAELAFPTTGIVTEVFVEEGTVVRAGEVLATLGSAELVARRNEALAQVQLSKASYDKLIAGVPDTEREVAQTSLSNAQQSLARAKVEETEKVEKAKRALLSNDLEARARNQNEKAAAPEITGSYTCGKEGSYTINVYSSNAYSGYSYTVTGLEESTGTAFVDQPSTLGDCGLFIQFNPDDLYANSTWEIDVPNKRSATYLTYANAYELALQTQINAVADAEDALRLAEAETGSVLADPRSEEIREKNAAVDQAYATLAQVDAQLADRSVTAPFDGMVTNVNIVKGETAGNTPVITMLASDAFTLKARIPEIDITKIQEGQEVTARFDAAALETQTGSVSYVSPLAISIDGVAYFEATIELNTTPTWLRSGLNADVDITVEKRDNVLRIPNRFLITNEDGTFSVQIPEGNSAATSSVDVPFSGNDGFSEVAGLNEGDVVIAP